MLWRKSDLEKNQKSISEKFSDAGVRKKKATRSHPKFSNASHLKHVISVVLGLAKGYKMSL